MSGVADLLALRRDGVYVSQPGWRRHLMRLAAACATMVLVLAVGLWQWPEWGDWTPMTRVLRLGVLIAAGGTTFLATLFACGFRLRDLRAA